MMLGNKKILFVLTLCLFTHFRLLASWKWKLNKDRSVTYSVNNGKAITIYPRFVVLYRPDDPKLHYENSTGPLTKFADGVNLPCWNGVNGAPMTANYFEAGNNTNVVATQAKAEAGSVTWSFAPNALFGLSATLSFPAGAEEPVIHFNLTTQKDGYYSVGYAGMPEIKPGKADAIWQPWIWQEKRFPQNSYLSVAEMCSIPSTMVEKDGYTYGLVTDPAEIPFKLPNMAAGNIRFGVLLRNRAGNAQPMVFAPVLGNAESKFKAGQNYAFSIRVLHRHVPQLEAHRYVAEHILGFKDYRKNVFSNLNQTVENMVRYGMDDLASGWNPELKGFDYTADVAQTVKVVSGMHPLAVSFITDDENIYRRRAVPMIEFNLSRERFLFTIKHGVDGQNASSRLVGPGVEVSELTALDLFYHKQSPAFGYFADSLKHTTRILNLKTKSPGDSWANLLGLYKMHGDKAILAEAMKKADAYIQKRINTPQTDFSMAGSDHFGSLSAELSSQFWTDYAPMWIELLDLYEVTGVKRYLDAAVKGAKLYTQFVWFNPVIPDSTIHINDKPADAWRVSQIGLTPEASNTFNWNPAIFLTSWAPHFLRLAHYTNDDYLRSIARSAVIGRYSNFPGYQIYRAYGFSNARPDYPYNLNLHSLFYYNHIWPQIAMLYDYMISDVFAQSNGAISFPNQFVPAYAYLKSKAYGYEPGKFYTDSGVYLWMPAQLLKIDNEQINYVSGYNSQNFYVALTNQSKETIQTEVSINPTLLPFDTRKHYQVRVWQNNKVSTTAQLINGKVKVTIAPGGITALAIDSLPVSTQFQRKIFTTDSVSKNEKGIQLFNTPYGKFSAVLLGLGKDVNTGYFWLDAQGDKFDTVSLHHRVAGTDKWTTETDSTFPFEFSVPFAKSGLEYKVEYLKGKQVLYSIGPQQLNR